MQGENKCGWILDEITGFKLWWDSFFIVGNKLKLNQLNLSLHTISKEKVHFKTQNINSTLPAFGGFHMDDLIRSIHPAKIIKRTILNELQKGTNAPNK